MVAEHDTSAARQQQVERLVERVGQRSQLVVHLDADRLKRAIDRVAAAAPSRGGDRTGHHLAELGRGLDRSGIDDLLGDTTMETFVAVAMQHLGELLCGVVVHDIVSGQGL